MLNPTYTVDLPRYTLGPEAYELAGALAAETGTRAALLVGAHGYAAAKERLEAGLRAAEHPIAVSAPMDAAGDCTEAKVARLMDEVRAEGCDLILAVGGGKVLDSGKAVAERLGLPLFTFPTIASNCAGTTAVAIMYKDDGSFERPYFLSGTPTHCFIHPEVLAEAPPRYLWAGMGDTYAKHYEAVIASRGEALPHPLALGVRISGACAETVLTYGEAALAANRRGEADEAFVQTLLTVIVTTGIVSLLVTLDKSPDYNSDLAHAIYYSLTGAAAFDHDTQLHGAVVGYGVLILLLVDRHFEPASYRAWEGVVGFNEAVKLPVCLADMGLTLDDMAPLYTAITEMSDVRHHPYAITPAMVEEAVREQERWAKAHGHT